MRPVPSYLVEVTGDSTIIIRLQVAEKDMQFGCVPTLIFGGKGSSVV